LIRTKSPLPNAIARNASAASKCRPNSGVDFV
jgi:hypothetical protein